MKQITKFKRFLSGVLSMVMAVSAVPIVSVHAEESTDPYPYTLFAASDSDGAITVNAGNFCVNGNVATNGTIVSSGNVNINGTKTEYANESMLYVLKKLNNYYFSGENVETYTDDYVLEDLNININNPIDVDGTIELTGSINLNSGIKAVDDVKINGEVKNSSNAVICSETGNINIETSNVSFNGLIYAPYGDIVIDSDNLNLNNVIIIGQTITIDCPNVNANYSRDIAELIGTISDDSNISDIDNLDHEREPFEDIGDAYFKEPTEYDIVFDEETGLKFVRNQLLISALPSADKSIFEDIAEEVGARIVGYIALTNDYQIEFTEEKTLEDINTIAEYIDSYSFVSCVTLNIVSDDVAEYTSNDTMYNDGLTCDKQWIDTDGDGETEHHADYRSIPDKWDSTNPSGDNWNLEAMNVPDAWDLVDSTQSVRVGVYDEAFDYADDGSTMHEDLIFEDVRNNKPRSSFTLNDGHGTHVSGILAGQHNNNCGISAAATNTRLYAYACSGTSIGSSMGDKIAYATLVGSHVKVINVSLGMGKDIMFAASRPDIDSSYATKAQNEIQAAADILEEYLSKLVAAGYDFVICTSAGNTNNTQFVVDTSEPYGVREATNAEKSDTTITKESGDVLARWDCALTAIDDANLRRRIIVVGSIANAGSDTYTISSFSNIGDRIDIMAPGSDILSTVPVETDSSNYRLMSGTSMASPAVASVVAMMYQVNPALKAGNIKYIIRNCSTKSVSDGTLTYPIPDAVECCKEAAHATDTSINDNDWPTGIICGYTEDDSQNKLKNVQFTAIRKSTGDYNLSDYSFQFSSDDEGYFLQVLPQGTYDIIVSASGFLPYVINNVVVIPDETNYMDTVVLSKWTSVTTAVHGKVIDALTGNVVSGAVVKLRKNWNNKTGAYSKTLFGNVRSDTTDSNGKFSISVGSGCYTAEITKSGYVVGYFNVISGDELFATDETTTMVLTPILSDNEYRIVLTWGSTPSDLDSHLTYYVNDVQKMHVYYSKPNGSYNGNNVASLDLDDTSSYGPETITIHLNSSLLTDNSVFRYSVHDYSDGSSSTTTNLANSNAVIHLYKGNTLLNTYHVPQNGTGSVWHVFDIDSTGVHSVNSFYGENAGNVK